MEAHAEHANHHHEMPTEGRALWNVSISATLHCLTGCAIGEVLGVAIGTALGWSDLATIALAIGLAFLFGYGLTSLPLLRAGLALSAVIPIALASDTLSIATMELVDNALLLVIPGAMDAGLGDLLFWGALSFALVIAFLLTVPVNRALIARGKGHCAVHETGIHGGPNPKAVGVAVIAAAIFGVTVLTAEAFSDDEGAHGETSMAASAEHEEGSAMAGSNEPETGVASGSSTLDLDLEETTFPVGAERRLSFRVLDAEGTPVQDFDTEHAKQMHLIVVRQDLTGFQHLHPTMSPDGTWSTPLTLAEPGTYRVFADFSTGGESETLTADAEVAGQYDAQPLSADSDHATAAGGYEVQLEGGASSSGAEQELAFTVTRNGEPVAVQPYLGADGHLVAIREGDLAYLHVHPLGGEEHTEDHTESHADGGTEPGAGAIRFMTEFPTEGRYRLFLQFRHAGEVRTAEFTRSAAD
jgi:hypothetical protein